MHSRIWLTLGALIAAFGCSSGQDAAPDSARGGAVSANGGAMLPSNGGANSSGGTTPGGASAAGGASFGGSTSRGGATSGGTSGGAGTAPGLGGAPNIAGTAGTNPGGSTGAGGTSASAGMTGTDPNQPVYNYGASVENSSAGCDVAALAEPATLPAIPKLPDPFKKLDGAKLSKRAEWHCRRQEILKQAEKYIYGTRPKPDSVSGTVSKTQVTVHVEAMGKAIDFSAEVVLPTTGTGPFPAIINVGVRGTGGRGITLEESRILQQGVAVIYFNHNELGREGQPEQSRGKPNPGKFYDIYGGTHSAGLLQAWSWGASRLIDVLQASDKSVIDPQKLGVTGCSRNGKGAFTIGLFDERIALTIPHETSTGGVPAYRIVDVLNTERTDHNYNGLNWLSNDFAPFVYKSGTSNAVKLPIDTHSLIASMAPRGLLILENPHQTQMSAPAGHTAAVAGAEVYKALGVAQNISYHSAVAQTPHCSYKQEYTEVLIANIKKFLKHESAETGQFNVGQNGSLKLSDWKDWEAPALSE